MAVFDGKVQYKIYVDFDMPLKEYTVRRNVFDSVIFADCFSFCVARTLLTNIAYLTHYSHYEGEN